jgi:hypothetical protein
MRELAERGCGFIVIIHDLDRGRNMQLNDEKALRDHLHTHQVPAGVHRSICIPVEEMEAWWWSDPDLVKRVGRGKGKAIASPHLKASPKEALQRLSCDAGGKPLYSTNDNPSLAKAVNLDLCAKKCHSFASLRDFFVSAGAIPPPALNSLSRVRGRSARHRAISR